MYCFPSGAVEKTKNLRLRVQPWAYSTAIPHKQAVFKERRKQPLEFANTKANDFFTQMSPTCNRTTEVRRDLGSPLFVEHGPEGHGHGETLNTVAWQEYYNPFLVHKQQGDG